MANLITYERALANLNHRTMTAPEGTMLGAAISAASKAIESYCRRQFTLQNHDEVHDRTDPTVIMLKHSPLISVERVSYNPQTVLTVKNTTAEKAFVRVHDTGLELSSTTTGVNALTTILWTDEVTLADLASAIAAVSGWTAQVTPGFTNWPSQDFRPLQGGLNARNTWAPLIQHVDHLAEYEVEAGLGYILPGSGPICESFILGREARSFWRVLYTAGYENIPEDLQEACAAWAALMFWQMKRDPMAQSTSELDNADGAYTQITASLASKIPETVLTLIRTYRRFFL